MKSIQLKKYVKENFIFVILLAMMTVYYAFLVFHMKPWYDELYTYYSFISRGPVYSAIHWPVPNNHVFYSVLSGFLDYLGNSYIGLRGISFIAAVMNMILLYQLAKKFVNKYLSVACVILYVSAYQVNNLSVQGRGYTLTTMCYLIAIHCLYVICNQQAKRIHYCIYACALTGGLYAIVSSTFWVLPICFAGGFYLLYKKDYKTLFRLILASLVAACMTLFLYTLIWLAIGSNLLCKNPDSVYYGIYQVKIILQAPFAALRTGMEYMLATPYIQGDERSYIVAELFNYLSGVFHLHFSNMGEIITIFMGIGAIFIGICLAKKKYDNDDSVFVSIYLLVSIIMLPVMLIVQSVQPYFRVFTFFSVPVAMMVVWIIKWLIGFIEKDKIQKYSVILCLCVIAVFGVMKLDSEEYQAQYAGRENEIAEIFETETEKLQSICYMDDYQKYVLKFYYDLEPMEDYIGTAQYVLMPKEIYQEDYLVPVWPTLYTYESVEWDKLEREYTVIKETANYYLYAINGGLLDID